MFKTILVPTDGSPLSDKAIRAAVEFAKETGATLVGLSVAEPYPFTPLAGDAFIDERKVYDDRAIDTAQKHVARVAAAALAQNVPCETVVKQSFSPSEEIIHVAEKFGCDVVFMASHGRKALVRLFLGSETQKVLTHSTIPVLVLR